MRAFNTLTFSALLGVTILTCACASHKHLEAGEETPVDTYAIVASASVFNDTVWNDAIIGELQKKYPSAPVIVWKKHVNEAKERLAQLKPAFTAFAVKPGEAGVRLTIDISHLTRNLDADPYPDTFWGVITGYDAEAARKVAAAEPILIERALDCSGCDITAFQQAWRYSEDHRGTMKTWNATSPNAEIVTSECNTDNTMGVLERLQKDKVQFLATSGHATQHDWQMGYCGPNMVMTHKEGKLVAIDTQQQGYYAQNDEPKVYFANGNCLIGDVDQLDCMALTWMRDGGVRQMMGYTVTTWHGAQGWGTLGLFTDTAGMTTAAEAFHFTNTGIVENLEKAIKTTGATDIRSCRLGKLAQVNRPITRQTLVWYSNLPEAEQLKQRPTLHNIIGDLHDRDTVCFYGDPALEARIANGRLKVLPPVYDPAKQTLTLSLYSVSAQREGAVWFRLPGDWIYAPENVVASETLGQPDLCLDNMIRFPNAKVNPNEIYTVTIKPTLRESDKCPTCEQ